MKKFNIFLGVITILILSILISCSEDSSNNPTPTTDYSAYYPMTVGSWWVTESWRTDENFIPDSLIARDSTVVIGEEMKGGKLAKVKIVFDTFTGLLVDTTYEYYENNTLYYWGQANPFEEEGEGWLVRGSFITDKITMIDTTFENLDLEGFPFSGSLKMETVRGVQKIVNVKNQDYSAYTFDIIFNLNGTLKIPGFGDVPISNEMKGTAFLVKNIGLAQMLTTSIATSFGMSESSYEKQILVDWSIK